MKVVRNMSKCEFKKFNQGLEIVGRDQSRHKSTVEKGVCFFDADDCLGRRQVETWYGKIVATFEIDEKLLTEGQGRYPDWDGGFFDFLYLTEYSIPAYSKKNAKLIEWHYKRGLDGWEEWEENNEERA